MSIDFEEFLREKTAGSDIRERKHIRLEWIDSLKYLLDKIQQDLRAADPESLLEFERYEVRRAESRLGVYDAPALKIRLNADEVTVLPIGRYAIGPLSAETHQALLEITGTDGPAAGRVDISDGERKYMLFRDAESQPERWISVYDRSKATLFDRAHLETMLRDLWS